VGIVNGMEILQAFDVSNDVKEGLGKFRHWLDGFNPADAIGGSTSVSKSLPSQEAVFHEKHRLARTRWVAPSDFPSQRVLEAYLKPVVDKSNARFSWGIPDLDGLRSFCSSKIGWEPGETDQIVIPVIKKMEDPSRQTRIESYFMNYDDKIKFAHVRSKRLRDIIQNIQQPPQQKVSEVSSESQNLAPDSQEINNLVDHTITSESRGFSKKKSKSRKETRKRKAK
jgi:DNA excision repair protein ERCC-5